MASAVLLLFYTIISVFLADRAYQEINVVLLEHISAPHVQPVCLLVKHAHYKCFPFRKYTSLVGVYFIFVEKYLFLLVLVGEPILSESSLRQSPC